MAIQSNFPAIKPSLLLDFANTKQLDPRITYTRASTASFYNGVTTAKAEENLILQSQTLESGSWTKAGGSSTTNSTAAPDGTTTADTFTEDTTTGSHNIYQTFSGTTALPYTWSTYVKANGRTKVVFFCQATGVIYSVRFDLTGVTTTNVSGTGTATITDAGNGWYRITATATSTATGTGYWQLNLADASNNTTYTGDGTSGVYLWGGQVEQRSAVSAYTATITQAITNYIPALQTAASGVARFDNNPTTGESLGLLIEESRTNLSIQSSAPTNAAWSTTRASTTASANIAPDGTQTCAKLVEDTTATNTHLWLSTNDITVVTATTYTTSIYAKKAERNFINLQEGTGVTANAYFNLNTGAVGTVAGTGSPSATITSVGNGWYRCTLTFTSSGTAARIRVYLATADGTTTYTGDGFSGVFIWGAQMETGAFATSYIPTVASQVTRAADAASMTGTNFSTWYNSGEGTFYGEASSLSGSAFRSLLRAVDNSTVNNYFEIGLVTGTNNGVGRFQVYSNGASQWDTGNVSTPAFVANTFYKVIAGSKVNDFAGSRDSGTVATDTAGTVANNLAIFEIGGRHLSPSNLLNGTIKKLAYYPLRVTNAQLQALTS